MNVYFIEDELQRTNVLSKKYQMKSIYLILTLLTFSFFANAQTQISVGARVGLNIANQRVEINGLPTDRGPRSIKVLDVAIPVEISFSEKFAIQPEFHFTRKGEVVGFENDMGQNVSIECRYDYFDLPLLLKYDFDSGGGKLYAIAGPLLSYGLGGTEFIMVDDQSEENDIDFEDRFGLGQQRIYDRLNIGAVVGLGVEASLKRGSIVADLRYGLSFDNVFAETIGDDVLTVKNYAITISIGYMHDFGKKRNIKRKDVDDGYEILK